MHALVGENGAGKSTLIKVMTGAVRRRLGNPRRWPGGPCHDDARTSRALGIAAIYQQPCVVSASDGCREHRVRARAARRHGAASTGAARRRERADLLHASAPISTPIGSSRASACPSSSSWRLPRRSAAGARMLIMDEPTASLSDREVERLFEVIARLRSEGSASSTSRIGSKKFSRSPIASPCCATAAPSARTRATACSVRR